MEEKEYIRIKKVGKTCKIKAKLQNIAFKQDNFIVFYLPSIKLSGYGKTLKEAKESLEFSVESYFNTISELSITKMRQELNSLGWHQNKFKTKEYSHSFIDIDGVLNNFDLDKKDIIEKSMLEVA